MKIDKRRREYRRCVADINHALFMFGNMIAAIHVGNFAYASFAQHEFIFNTATSYYYAGIIGLVERNDWPVPCKACYQRGG